MPTIGFILLGCAKNLVDAQVMAGELIAAGHTLAPRPEEADILIVNTCSFIHDAREESAQAVLSACAHRDAGNCRAVIATGCLPQRYGKQFLKAFPGVNAAVGIDQLDQVTDLVKNFQCSTGNVQQGIFTKNPSRVFNPRLPTLLFSGGPFAYLKIAEGCSHRCAYCAIPNIRGKYRSRATKNILDEARALVNAGVREINLIAQDTTSFGNDVNVQCSTGNFQQGIKHANLKIQNQIPVEHSLLNIEHLISSLAAIGGDFWIRLLYAYPSLITGELLQLIATSPKILPYLDVPIQHSHPEILRRMNRGQTVDAVASLAPRLRDAVPGITIRTTCMVGFPGETEAHFEHLLDHVRAARYDHLGAFAYSPEEGTPAFDWKPVPQKTARARLAKLLEVQKEIVREKRKSLIGQTTHALLLRPQKNGKWLARVERQAPDVDGHTVLSNVPATVRSGELVNVKITNGRGYDLAAECCQNS